MKAISIDLGGTRIKIGIVEREHVIESSLLEVRSIKGLRPYLNDIEGTISSLLHKTRLSRGELAGIGMATPGIIDPGKKRVLSVNEKYFDAVGFDFTGWSKDRFNAPLVLENDARAAIVGEWKYGAGTGCDNVVMVTLGTGIGTSAVIEGKLLRGEHFQAGILGGHMTINLHGVKCNCGNIGCAESEASSWSLPGLVTRHPHFNESRLSKLKTIDYRNLFASAAQGDDLSRTVIDESLLAWSSCIINLIHAYDPERVILGGGIMRSADVIIPFIKQRVDQFAWTPWGKVEVIMAHDMDNAALRGIGYLVNQEINHSM